MSISGEKRDHQNFFFLSCIQISSLGLAPIAVGNLLSQQYGPGTAIGSIIVGNLILWLIGISIISMSHRVNLIQTIQAYLGRGASLLISAIFIGSALNWFAFSLNATTHSLQEFIQTDGVFPKNVLLRLATALGVFTALLSLGGIRLLKWVSVVTLPFLAVYFGYRFCNSDLSIRPVTWGVSLAAVITVIFSLLGGVVNLPTFFKHSKSRADSYLALAIYGVFYILFQCSTVWINFKDPVSGILMGGSGSLWAHSQFIIIFLMLVCICNNLLNIYFASAFFEAFSPRFVGMKGHAIMGLMGTAVYAFLQVSSPIAFALDLIDAYIANLTIVLLVGFLLRLVIKHPSNNAEKWVNSAAWFFGSVAATIAKLQKPEAQLEFVFIGMNTTLLFFLLVAFFEKTSIAIRDLRLRKVRK